MKLTNFNIKGKISGQEKFFTIRLETVTVSPDRTKIYSSGTICKHERKLPHLYR